MLSGAGHEFAKSCERDADEVAASGAVREAKAGTELMRQDVNRLLMITKTFPAPRSKILA